MVSGSAQGVPGGGWAVLGLGLERARGEGLYCRNKAGNVRIWRCVGSPGGVGAGAGRETRWKVSLKSD